MCRLLNLVIPMLLCACAFGADGGVGTAKAAGDSAGGCKIAVLVNGFALQYTRRQTIGANTRLWLCDVATGYLEVPTGQIEHFEQGESLSLANAESAPAGTAINRSPEGKSIKGLIRSAALRNQIDPDFVASVVKAESGFNPRAISPKGAQGLMQLMPHTAEMLGVENVFDAAANVEAGTKYLHLLLEQYDGDAVKALAAYNAGPQKVKDFGGVPPFPETRAYVVRVIQDFNARKLEQLAKTHKNKH